MTAQAAMFLPMLDAESCNNKLAVRDMANMMNGSPSTETLNYSRQVASMFQHTINDMGVELCMSPKVYMPTCTKSWT